MELWIAKVKPDAEHPIQKLEKLLIFDRDHQCYMVTEYEGGVVVKVPNKKVRKVFLSHYGMLDDEERIPLVYDKQWDVWYDQGDESNERAPVGLNQCGTFFFEGEDENGYIIERSGDVYITSSLLTKEEFQQMKDEICSVLEDFLVVYQGPVSPIKRWTKRVETAQNVWERMKKLSVVLIEIAKVPHEKLSQERQLTPVQKIKRLDAQVLINRRLFPFKNQLLAPVNVRSIDIPEHRMIRWGLERIIDQAERHIRQMKNEREVLNRRRQLLKQERQGLRGLNLFDRQKTESSIHKNLGDLSEVEQHLEENERYWDEIRKMANECLQLPYLDVGEEEMEQTHLFIFSPLYREAYQYLDGILNDQPSELSIKQLSHVYVPLQKSPNLYETWCLLSIVHSLIYECGFVPSSHPYHQIKQYMENKKQLRGISFSFHRPVYRYEGCVKGRRRMQETTLFLELCYEHTFSAAGKSYRPDFTFIFTDQLQAKKTIAFLDAKYRPVDNQSCWLQLVRDTSFQKYYAPLSEKPIASFLIHPGRVKGDDTWNARLDNGRQEELRHRLGSFHYRPNDKKELVKWINMLLHYHLEYDGVCMHCGTHDCAELDDRGWKQYFTCKRCAAFWVETYCFNRKRGPWVRGDAHDERTAKLFKYTKHSGMNYHKETNNEWDVFCPVCGKRAQDRKKSG
ncbi:hypothetical protein B1690_14260 [Geobacillus sp. 46C-IIa]|uniref:DUF2357 domain-containing protein n=1 Tax=Geobacillus sp. 46C-IIa TaxID=1963025 RepID=UPI0009BD00F0|nr:DUF2357 domain-containing protein [Geobacillus sp. 46C-IIa]OQP05153.1 hypothetical protein B1690_14260 [Geobacillus sp. 46C-IIa]QNU28081.1 DUF2357 domain-containing protein [Geobacillus sp. 46C-IIa]